ncbi:hypothetical protein OX90_04535 [Pseudomonas coronafaciens pv. porri]|uniref:Uncharacterized protein n=1 Tax=Pseudomonas coronafaciens pv. porri TaxID=83964 RepID=A0ABR5JT94_9PSED|nr:hypothetical protein OA77_12360 [Pseudomonas coronafaciens]KOP52585.1 hypothetical protein OX88_23290 [Pseudomonas coronafaciens pv. porri]KOP60738.1 hypothetical protein OX90_04535 [Pseudomonas coronafaciens pv. porri]
MFIKYGRQHFLSVNQFYSSGKSRSAIFTIWKTIATISQAFMKTIEDAIFLVGAQSKVKRKYDTVVP